MGSESSSILDNSVLPRSIQTDDHLFVSQKCYLAPPDEDEDPAVYQASKPKAKEPATDEGSDDGSDAADDEPLLTSQPSFNRLLIVMRDAKVMKFTKYLSAEAPCCRWDVGGEWEVGMVEEEE